MIRSFVVGGLMAASSTVVHAQLEADTPEAPAIPAYISEVRTQLDRAVQDERIVGLAAAVIENGEPVLVYTHGQVAADNSEPVAPDTLFRAASVSKTFTGTLLALLEENGLLDLDASMPPDLLTLENSRAPTVLEVVSHQTGLPPNAYDLDLEAGQRPQRIRERLSDVDLICPVGECYTYQNIAFSAVEELVERATGDDFETAVQNWLFEPLNMPSASIGVDQLTDQNSWARPHRGWRRRSNQAGNPQSYYDRVPSAGGINLSLEDMIAWAQSQLGTRPGLPESVRARAHAPQVETIRETRRLGELRRRVDSTWYGMGWRIYDWGDRRLVMHSGYLSGYGAQIVMEPDTGFAFVALWNSDNRPAWWLWPAVMDLRLGEDGSTWLDRFDDD